MKLHYDPESDSLYLRLSDSSAAAPVDSQEVRPGIVLDLDAQNRVVGIEIRAVKAQLPDADVRRLQLEVA